MSDIQVLGPSGKGLFDLGNSPQLQTVGLLMKGRLRESTTQR